METGPETRELSFNTKVLIFGLVSPMIFAILKSSQRRCSVIFRHVSPQSVSGFGWFSTNITL